MCMSSVHVNTTVLPIPSHLLTECARMLIETHQPRLKLNTYHTVSLNLDLIHSDFREYFCLYADHTVCCETVTVPVLPTHRDVFNQIGQRQRQCHCVLNCDPRSIQLIVGGVHILLPSNHWYLLHSQTRHSAVCEPPHSLITVDAHLGYSQYAALLGLY